MIIFFKLFFIIFFSYSINIIKAEEIKIGVSTFLSGGAASSFGIPLKQSLEFMFNAINKGNIPEPYNTPGIGGKKISYFFIDESGGATKQVSEFRNMVQRQNVDIVMGYVSSGDCLAIPSVAEELKQLTVLIDCGTPRVFEEASYKYVFRTGPHAAMDNIAGALFLKRKGITPKKIAAINQNYAWGQDSWADFKGSIDVMFPGTKVVSEQFPKIFSGQYGSEISAIMVSRPDLIHSSMWGGDLESFIIQGNTRGLFRKSVVFLSAGDHVMENLKKNMPEGVIIGARGPHGDLAPNTPLANWFKESLKKELGIKMTTQPMHKSAMAALFIKKAFDDAVIKTGTFPTTDEVIKIMEGLKWETPSGNVEMALGNGHQAIQDMALGITKWDNEEKRVKLVDIEYFKARCVNPPEGIKSLEWIKNGFEGAEC
ncbi:ABC transporter substrate-binding protein [Alphaproteobacteria bacterium]|nr:ABC transporter substrate-binding protein [Alphaproteobacteria bacterium]